MTYREWHKKQAWRRREDAAIRAMYWLLAALLVGALLALLVVPAHAEEQRTEKLAVLAAMAWIDYDQSAGWVTPGGRTYELNPILGEHPSRGDMLAFGATGLGLLWLAGEVLPEPWATVVLDSAITSERWNIEDNVLARDGRRRINAVPVIITWRW
jgi:hypothetical protein